MCLAIPARVKEIKGSYAVVDYGGVTREASLDFVQDVEEGDYVVVHLGYAISKLSEREAEESLNTWRELLERLEDER